MKPLRKYSIKTNGKESSRKLSISTAKGYELLNTDSILYLKADTCYTTFFLEDDSKIIATKNLGYYEKRLSNSSFIRIHHSIIVNLSKVSRYIKNESSIVLINKKLLPVSRTRKTSFLRLLKQLC